MALNIQAGEMNQRIDLFELLETPGRAGGNIKEWRRIKTLFARVRPLTGTERFASDRIEGVGGFHVIVRNQRGLNEKQSLCWDGRRHGIKWIKARGPRSLYIEIETDLGAAI